MDKINKYLLAINWYDQSLDMVHYFSKIIEPKNDIKVVLLHIDIQLPEVLFDQDRFLKTDFDDLPIDRWSEHEKKFTKAALETARNILIDTGFLREAISIKLLPLQHGVARDILAESYKGYSALIIGRSETHTRNDTSMGSVTTKLITNVTHIPLAVVGGVPNTRMILVGFDQSKGAEKSLDFIRAAFRKSDSKVTLCHIIRTLKLHQIRDSLSEYQNLVFTPDHELKWKKVNKMQIEPVIEEAKRKLISTGWPHYHVSKKIIVNQPSISQCLMDHAKNEGYGTIVLGRRGISLVREFFLGRVGHKVLAKANKMAVWIIS